MGQKIGEKEGGGEKEGRGGGEERTTVASPPPPTAYFATLSQFSFRSRAFGKEKETAATQASQFQST